LKGQEGIEAFFQNASFTEFSEEQFPKNRITRIDEDPFGYIWIGTNKSGLYRYNGYQVEAFNPNYKSKDSYPDVNVFDILVTSDSSIWFCHEEGFSTYDYEHQKFINSKEMLSDESDYLNSIALTAFEVNDSILLFGMKDGIRFFNKKTNQIVRDALQNNSTWDKINYIKDIHQDPNNKNKVWLRARDGMYAYNLISHEHERYDYLDSGKPLIDYVSGVVLGTKIFFPNYSRLRFISFDLISKESKIINLDEDRNNYGFDVAYNWLMKMQDHSMLMSNSRHEMWQYYPKKEFLKRIEIKDNFDFGINPFLFDANGYFWFSRDWSLFKSDQAMPSMIRNSIKTSKLFAVKINDNLIDPARFISGSLTLREFEKNIQLRYGQINPDPKDSIQYEYQVRGESNQWQSIDSNVIEISNLGGGDYTINIATIIHGMRSEDQLLTIKKERTLLENNWFWLLSIGTIGALIFTYNKIRINHVRKQERLRANYEKQLSALQMEALQSQMNPHFIFNALNSIKHFILTNEKFKAAEYLSGFSSLVRQVLNNSKSPIINLEKEIETLKLYIDMEQMRFDDKFSYLFHIDGNLDLLEINLPPLIFQPYVENAIWHGLMHKEGVRKLDIYFKKVGQSLHCTIEDNGIGRANAMATKKGNLRLRKSFGMQITQDRMEINQLKADIKIIDKEDNNGNPTGTKVIIKIPLKQSKN